MSEEERSSEKIVVSMKMEFNYFEETKKKKLQEHLGGSVVEHLLLAQVMIPGSWDQVWHQAPHREPASLSAYVSVSLSVSLMNKQNP